MNSPYACLKHFLGQRHFHILFFPVYIGKELQGHGNLLAGSQLGIPLIERRLSADVPAMCAELQTPLGE